MALTNLEIIETEMLIHGISEDVDTYAGWKRHGYQVNKGSKALFTTRIWKPCKITDKSEDEPKVINKMIMVKAAFFGRSQVARG